MVTWKGKRECRCERVQGVALKEAPGKRRLILLRMYENITKIALTFCVNLENNRKISSPVLFCFVFIQPVCCSLSSYIVKEDS